MATDIRALEVGQTFEEAGQTCTVTAKDTDANGAVILSYEMPAIVEPAP